MKDYRFIEMVRDETSRPIWQSAAIETLSKAGYVIENVIQVGTIPGVWIAVLVTMSKEELV